MVPSDRKIIRGVVQNMLDKFYMGGENVSEVLEETVLACVELAKIEGDFELLKRIENYA